MLQDASEFNKKILHEAVTPIPDSPPQVDAKLFDGAAVIQMLSPELTSTSQGYVDVIVLPYIMQQLDSVNQIDIF